MVENAGFMPKDVSVAKRVWYGVGKAVESQSPKAWEARILRVIDEKIVPKLSSENQQWMAEIRPKVEKFAKVAGVAIPVVEVVAVVGSTVYLGKKIYEGVRIYRQKILDKKSETRTTPFDLWLLDIRKQVLQKYDATQASVIEGTIRQMGVDIGTQQGKASKWRSIFETAQKGSPAAVNRAKRRLEQMFIDAHVQAHGGVDKKIDPEKARQMYTLAREAFAQWENVQFPGLGELMNEGPRYPSSRLSTLKEIIPKFWKSDGDDNNALSFNEILFAWRKGDPELLREMAKDPKWTRVVELMPNSPWGDILDRDNQLFDESAKTIPFKPNARALRESVPKEKKADAPKRELSWWEKREIDKIQREELRLRKEKYGPRNRARKQAEYDKETARLRAKQTDTTGVITYRDRLNELANASRPKEPVIEQLTPEQLLQQENEMWLEKIREIAKRREARRPKVIEPVVPQQRTPYVYGERFSQIINTHDQVVPQALPETPPFIDRMQRNRATAIASENTAMPVAGEDERAWWRERKANGLSTQTLTDTLRAEDQEIKSMLARDEAQRQAHRAAERARVDARRANRDPLATTLRYVFRGEQTPARQEWFERVLTRAQDMAGTDRDMRDLLATATAIGGNTIFDRTEEAAVMARVLDRAFHTLPKNQQDWRGFKPNSDIFYTMASDLVGRFHRAEVPLALTQGVEAVNAGDVLVNRLLETNDKKVRELVRKVASIGTNRGEKVEVFEPTHELIDLFSYAYRQLIHTPNSQQLSNNDMRIVSRIAKQFVRNDVGAIGKLYKMYPAK